MPPPILRKILGPRVRRFNPTAPLYVRRRISLGPDDAGVMRWLEPGAVFDATGVKPMRIAGLFSSRHIAHEAPPVAVAAPVDAPTAAPDLAAPSSESAAVEPEPATVIEPPKPPRRGRG